MRVEDMLRKELLEILVCPKCHAELEYRESPESLICNKCSLIFEVREGIPIMLLEEAKPLINNE